ncbi:MAG: flagellar motor switch protein FliG [Bdellovibrionales bacterium RIFOXYD12_FULL_39_22]|nr:MAG: flagellar motor switch protein FliG [Bdellovibrionales bacterium RIFOXYB1_FULL_39_21]OFZ42158.1 MAG: flagellar motor switch protein FliG [Bdellovibrionales bacterium RIFOXYC12_FULL_39_17]OFZ50979.1 MAG: flagellar motor switch protein FliG [Bdellovibrionales bacterium RIFOXYC1_FULL_39_130]OFZ78202.1 MAG: flagellar motor switch protein FliG [Bdellovibrionales bacterium RIFOXYD1_FULL_39_84]OFZ93810.1 MAG: flagellar motor switch protein FliG [Bdellovibrionales bacterium RIFOXYD12_FULL_39_22
MSGQDRAALLLSSLGMQTTQLIFQYMKDNDVKRMVNAMGNVKKAPIWMVKKVLEEFYSALNEDASLLFADNRGRDFIVSALGEDRAKQLLGQIIDVASSNTLESLELVDTRTLSNFLINEHPQTIALIIAHLSPERKVDVLRRLPEGLQAEVVLRVANLDYVSPELIAQLDDVLKTELSTLGSIDTSQIGGVEPIAEMLNLMDKNNEKNIMARVEEKDPELAEEIRKLMFVFEDLVYVDDRGVQNLLKEVDNQKLVIALKTAPEEIKTKLFKNMSNRAATLLKEDLDALGPTKLSDVEKAQSEIVQKAKELEAQGKAFISRGGDGDSLV